MLFNQAPSQFKAQRPDGDRGCLSLVESSGLGRKPAVTIISGTFTGFP